MERAFHHVRDDALCVVLHVCVVWVVELLPTHAIFENCARDRVALFTVTALDAAQYDRKESFRGAIYFREEHVLCRSCGSSRYVL